MSNKICPDMFVNGEPYKSSDVESIPKFNPATGETIGALSIASESDINQAVESSLEGFRKWSQWSGIERGKVLHKAAQIIRSRKEELVKLEVLETAKPIQEVLSVDIDSGADALEYFAGLAASVSGQHFNLGNNFAYTSREPLGVCLGLGAWNYPFQIACWKASPALACGNSMLFKPSEETPSTAFKLAEIFSEAGVPPGVFNVVQGSAKTGKQLVLHPHIAKVSLTGSVDTGKLVMKDAASTLKHVSMELGGKSPLIVFEDCHLDNAVSAALLANFYSQGEICSNGTRVFVQEKILKDFISRLRLKTENIVIGDPFDMHTQFGALISKKHKQKVIEYIDHGLSEGAKIIHGGKEFPQHLRHTKFKDGFFVKPTIFTNCEDNMKIVKEEIFGPVMTILSFKSEDEVIERANSTFYGLAAGVMTTNIQKAHRVVKNIQAGTCWINNYNITPVEIPFGGFKHSGLGRENSMAAIESYTQLKSVYVELGDIESPY